MNNNGRCFDCKYFANGQCRRRAPTVPLTVFHDRFPEVSPNGWCGEFESRLGCNTKDRQSKPFDIDQYYRPGNANDV
jgi:hypothetical protein